MKEVLKNIGWLFYATGTIILWLIWTAFICIVSLFEAIVEVISGDFKQQPSEDITPQFWIHVEQCLVKFHGMPEDRAWELITNKYDTDEPYYMQPFGAWELAANKYDTHRYGGEEPYHMQPFDVANDLAGKDIILSPEDYQKLYVEGILGIK